MTEQHENESGQKEWYQDAEDALERVGDALRGAWDASRDARVSALQSAKSAAQQLGDAIERGVAGARERWSDADTGQDEAEATEGEEE